MSKQKIKELTTVSSLLIGGGLLLMFLSYYWGTSFGEIWLESNLISEINDYNLLVTTFVRNFVIIGSILFGSGVLMGVLSYLHFVYSMEKVHPTNMEAGAIEVKQ